MKIFFLVPYPLKESPSQRFRFEQYLTILSANGYTYRVQSFLQSHNWQLFFKTGNTLKKIVVLLKGFLNRIFALFLILNFDFVFIHREAAPIGPPLFEWIIAKLLRKKIIYDFDDAIWLTDRSTESFITRTLKWRRKVRSICRWSAKISCGNKYLCSYALKFNKNAIVNPTTIDTEGLHNPRLVSGAHPGDQCIIGWTGSHSTLKYLIELERVMETISHEFPKVRFMVIADRPPQLKMKSLEFRKWNLETEIADLAVFDIGIMPLPDDEWTRGKCGFKALQYMAMEVATVASPVGVNVDIIAPYKTGLLASTDSEWLAALRELITDSNLRREISKNSREEVIRNYSVMANASNFLSLFASK